MPRESVRPMSVPAEAVWSEGEGQWEVVERDGEGRPHGPVKRWGGDGRLVMAAHYEAGVLHGPFQRFHADGRVAREGRYEAGVIDGEVWVHAGAAAEDEPLRGCCVPVGAARMQARYRDGALLGETFFDAEGFALLSSGERRPAKPDALASSARFDEGSRRWFTGESDESTGSPSGTWSWWRQDGSLSEQADFVAGQRVATRHYDAASELKEAIGLLVHDGFDIIPHGTWTRRLDDAERAAWSVPQRASSDAGPAWLEGHYDHGRSVGAWRARVGDAVMWQRELGVAEDAGDGSAPLPAVLRAEYAGADDAVSHAEGLRREGRVREALVALARAVGRGGDATMFLSAHDAWALPKPEATAQEEARRLSEDGKSPTVFDGLDALVTGARAADVFRVLVSALPGWSPAAHDLANACVTLDPVSAQSRLARAFVCIERADDLCAQQDIAHVAAVSDETAAFLRHTLRVLRPHFAFVPASAILPPLEEPVPLEPAQPLASVHHVVRVYATRLLQLRLALARFSAAGADWAPPDLSAWLPEGPVTLAKHDADIEDEDENGQPEVTTVHIDETLDLSDVGVGAIMRRARADWVGLCWLLWAVGQDDVSWPQDVLPRASYAQALSMAIQNAWRARDQVVTSGLRAMTQGLPDFDWEGANVAELPANLLDVCADEFLEMRAVLLWLSNAGNVSPFQNDLRQV